MENELTASRKTQAAWCFFDWANSAFPTVIVTFVFSAYFTTSVALNHVEGTALWGYAVSASALLIALVSPIVGAISDAGGQKKSWLAFFSLVCVLCTALLWYIRPDPDLIIWGLCLFVLANFAFEVGTVFYNAMLPQIVPPSKIGRLSGWGWGLGYAGGLCCLALVLLCFVQPERPIFSLQKETGEHIRIVGPLVAVWFVVFSAPLFFFVQDKNPKNRALANSAKEGLSRLVQTIKLLKLGRSIPQFLIARVFYVDGLNTLFAFGGIYAAGSFGMGIDEIIIFGIALNLMAGLGAVGFSWLDDLLGPKKTVLISLVAIFLLILPLLIIESKMFFWGFGLFLGIFVGPVQAASRSLMVRLAPANQITEMFGMFAFSGKITAFLCPLVLAAITALFGSQRIGMLAILFFLGVGICILTKVKEPIQ